MVWFGVNRDPSVFIMLGCLRFPYVTQFAVWASVSDPGANLLTPCCSLWGFVTVDPVVVLRCCVLILFVFFLILSFLFHFALVESTC